MQTGTSKRLRVIAKFPCSDRNEAFSIERELHEKYERFRGRGEWFKPAILRAMKCGQKRIIGGTHKNPKVRSNTTIRR
jgi:hypothetical protein